MNWVRACKGLERACSDFACAAHLTELVLVGNLAMFFPNRELVWDSEKMEVKNLPELMLIVKPPFRYGWSLAV